MVPGDRKPPRPTVRFDSAPLAKLTRDEAAAVAPADPERATEPKDDEIARPRTSTVQDPMTMALLAEVARTSRTLDRDEEPATAEEPPATAHPHVKRR